MLSSDFSMTNIFLFLFTMKKDIQLLSANSIKLIYFIHTVMIEGDANE